MGGTAGVVRVLPGDVLSHVGGLEGFVGGRVGPPAGRLVEGIADVASDGGADHRPERGGRRLAAPLAELVSDDRAGNAADEGAGRLVLAHGGAARQGEGRPEGGDEEPGAELRGAGTCSLTHGLSPGGADSAARVRGRGNGRFGEGSAKCGSGAL